MAVFLCKTLAVYDRYRIEKQLTYKHKICNPPKVSLVHAWASSLAPVCCSLSQPTCVRCDVLCCTTHLKAGLSCSPTSIPCSRPCPYLIEPRHGVGMALNETKRCSSFRF